MPNKLLGFETQFFPHIQIKLYHPRHAKIGLMAYAARVAQAKPAHFPINGYAFRFKKGTQGLVITPE
jgi:hypothetical protein